MSSGMESSSSSSSSSVAKNALPALPIPPPILSNVPGTWAFDTMSRRVESEILQRTFEENKEVLESPPFAAALQEFNALREELRNAATTPLRHLKPLSEEDKASEERVREYNEWFSILEPHVAKGDTWLSAPWVITEFYVYRRLMECLGYFDSSSSSATYLWDPFATQKRAGLESSVGSAESLLSKLENLPHNKEGLGIAAAFALWGNKMDLSLWPADVSKASQDVFSSVLASASENLLHDDSPLLANHCQTLRARGGGRVDIIVDNAGFELVTDLALADHLVSSGIASVVTFQLKKHPTFVSDALEKDLMETVDYYANLDASSCPFAQRAGERWRAYLKDGKWVCHEDYFWVQPWAMWDMTEPLRTDMAQQCDLAFVKGDANYRRLLGDRPWDLSAPFQDVVGAYFPCPVCALRTLKAELGCGMEASQVARAKSLEPEKWMVNGRFGVVQFGSGAAS